jgi:hypothetical protein
MVDFHQMRITVATRQLHNAQPVTVCLQAHGLGIDGNGLAKVNVGGKIVLMDKNRHIRVSFRSGSVFCQQSLVLHRKTGAANTVSCWHYPT